MSSTGAVSRCKASSSSNRQAPEYVHASGVGFTRTGESDKSAPRDRQAVWWGNYTALHGGSGDDALCAPEGPGVSLAPVPGPLSIAAGTVIVEVLVGWSPALPRRFPPPPPQKRPGVRADFLHIKKKKRQALLRSYRA